MIKCALNAICSSSSREQQRWVGVRASMQQQQQRRGGRGKTARVTDGTVPLHTTCVGTIGQKKELNYRRTPAVAVAMIRQVAPYDSPPVER
ncbi:MAG TPA: hypothetical protein VIJ25_12145 [Methylococcales bacterium]